MKSQVEYKDGLFRHNSVLYEGMVIAPIVVFVISVWLACVYEKAKMKFNEKRLPAS